MKISEENKKIIVDWITLKCGTIRCTCCGENKWVARDISTLQIGIDLKTTRFHFNNGLAVVTLECQNCGHIIQFNPQKIGIKPEAVSTEKTDN